MHDATRVEALDPWHAWMEAHPTEVKRHRGRFVAVHRTLGIVASATTAEGVDAKLAKLDVALDDLMFTSVL